jgi:hypothetical protein
MAHSSRKRAGEGDKGEALVIDATSVGPIAEGLTLGHDKKAMQTGAVEGPPRRNISIVLVGTG